MAFGTESTGYIKTSLSDLQGAWGNLRRAVVENYVFDDAERMLFHIDEAMSWESVRNLQKMKSTFLVIQNISAQSNAPDEVSEWVEDIRESKRLANYPWSGIFHGMSASIFTLSTAGSFSNNQLR